MDYISFIPIELIEIIVPYLDTAGLESFLKYHDVKNFINWNTVYTLHFNKIRNANYGLYFSSLSIEKLKEKLNLEGTEEEIYNWKSLNLSRNSIEEIPKEIGQLINLKELDLNNNRIKEIPQEIGKLINLEILNLDHNQIEKIPESIGKLINLKKLFLENNNLMIISSGIENLKNLNILDINNNQLLSITKDIFKIKSLTYLKYLFLNNNMLTTDEYTKLRSFLPDARIIF